MKGLKKLQTNLLVLYYQILKNCPKYLQ